MALTYEWRDHLTPDELADHAAAKTKADNARSVMLTWSAKADALRRKGVQRARSNKREDSK